MSRPEAQERFEALLSQHKKILWKVANAYCKSVADRPDLVQEIAVQLWRSFPRYDERLRFSTWTYRIALNVAISFHRSEARRARHTVPAEESLLEIAADPPASVDPDLETLHRFIAELEPLDRALVLLYLDGNPYDTIAQVLGISETNVGTKIGRIKQRLRRQAAASADKERI